MNMWQNLNKDENGFLHIELLILMAILSSVAMIYICMGILRNQQLNNGYRMTAIYLAQGYLNLMEEQKANIIPNQIECNGMKYMIKQKENFQGDIDEISIEISWHYHDQETLIIATKRRATANSDDMEKYIGFRKEGAIIYRCEISKLNNDIYTIRAKQPLNSENYFGNDNISYSCRKISDDLYHIFHTIAFYLIGNNICFILFELNSH